MTENIFKDEGCFLGLVYGHQVPNFLKYDKNMKVCGWKNGTQTRR